MRYVVPPVFHVLRDVDDVPYTVRVVDVLQSAVALPSVTDVAPFAEMGTTAPLPHFPYNPTKALAVRPVRPVHDVVLPPVQVYVDDPTFTPALTREVEDEITCSPSEPSAVEAWVPEAQVDDVRILP